MILDPPDRARNPDEAPVGERDVSHHVRRGPGQQPVQDLAHGERRERGDVAGAVEQGKETRARAGDFLTLCKTPELACEVTLQPLERFPLDAAILFSDILMIPWALGQDLSFGVGEGPRLEPALVDHALDRLQSVPERLEPVYEVTQIKGDGEVHPFALGIDSRACRCRASVCHAGSRAPSTSCGRLTVLSFPPNQERR